MRRRVGPGGPHVVCAARGMARLEAVVAELRAEGWSVEALAFDQADLEALEAAIGGRLFDIVVNSAGTAHPHPALDTTARDFDRVMNLNLRAAYFLSVHAARALKSAARAGSIIHISSQMGHVGGVERTLYCASKWGLEGMIRAMALDRGPERIRVNAVAPTFIRTPLTEPTFARPDRVAWIEDKIERGRVGEVEDIMGAVLYLASDAASLVTGTSLLVDGGWTAE